MIERNKALDFWRRTMKLAALTAGAAKSLLATPAWQELPDNTLLFFLENGCAADKRYAEFKFGNIRAWVEMARFEPKALNKRFREYIASCSASIRLLSRAASLLDSASGTTDRLAELQEEAYQVLSEFDENWLGQAPDITGEIAS